MRLNSSIGGRTGTFFCYRLQRAALAHAGAGPLFREIQDAEIPAALSGAASGRRCDDPQGALAMCENIDWNVGRVLDKLAELNWPNDTIVVSTFAITAPNGWRWNGGIQRTQGLDRRRGRSLAATRGAGQGIFHLGQESSRSLRRSICCPHWPDCVELRHRPTSRSTASI